MASASVENLSRTPYILLQSPTGKRYLHLVGKSSWTIGRSRDNDFAIPDQSISRNHAILQATENGEFYLIDLGSRNGTFINGRRVTIPIRLRDADQVIFGKTEVEFHASTPSLSTDNETGDRQSKIDTLTSVLHERRLMSVMVADMRNFTVLARQLDDKVLPLLIGNWFRQAGNIIRRAGSWVDKYIGDAVMAIWFHGHEEVNKEDILRIFQAVNDLTKMTQKLNLQYPLPFELRIGAGINTGYAMVGNTGSGDHPDYTAVGDTVNAAFRLESATKELGLDLAIGKTTYHYLCELQEAQQHFKPYEVALKGYEELTLTYGIAFEDLERFLEANRTLNSEC
jgi:adenylate cyclase